jgi:hypothetical protein
MSTRKYKGYEIRDWSGPYGQHPDNKEPKYFVQTKHETGVDWSAELCPQFASLAAAKEWINEVIGCAGVSQ